MSDLPEAMRALRLHGAGVDKLAFDDVPVPRPKHRELLCRVDAAIACASDSKIIDQGAEHTLMYGWDLGKHPVVIGHEGCVTVVAVGDGLRSEYAVGQRYAIQPAVPTGPKNNRERYRDNAAGIDKIAVGYTLDGLFSEYVLVGEEVIDTGCLLPLPKDDMAYFAAALAEPISCVVSAQEHSVHILKDTPTTPRRAQLGLKPGGVTAILGAGPMGRIHVELALRYKPRTVIVSDPLGARIEKLRESIAEKANRQGVKLVFTVPDEFETTLARESDGWGADDIIVALGIRQVQERAFSLLARHGVVNFFGGLKKDEHMISLDSRRIHYDSVMAVGSSGGDPSDVAQALTLLADGTVDAGNYVAAVGGLDAAKDLVEAVREQRLDGKGVIYPQVRGALKGVDGWDARREIEFLGVQG